jgi:hypothetical protein
MVVSPCDAPTHPAAPAPGETPARVGLLLRLQRRCRPRHPIPNLIFLKPLAEALQIPFRHAPSPHARPRCSRRPRVPRSRVAHMLRPASPRHSRVGAPLALPGPDFPNRGRARLMEDTGQGALRARRQGPPHGGHRAQVLPATHLRRRLLPRPRRYFQQLKVSDFGLSVVADQFHPDGLLHTFCGTPSYVAPEVLARRGTKRICLLRDALRQPVLAQRLLAAYARSGSLASRRRSRALTIPSPPPSSDLTPPHVSAARADILVHGGRRGWVHHAEAFEALPKERAANRGW